MWGEGWDGWYFLRNFSYNKASDVFLTQYLSKPIIPPALNLCCCAFSLNCTNTSLIIYDHLSYSRLIVAVVLFRSSAPRSDEHLICHTRLTPILISQTEYSHLTPQHDQVLLYKLPPNPHYPLFCFFFFSIVCIPNYM